MEEMLIKDAAKHLGIEAHVLRYWEEELGLLIKRNKMGHRYYDEKDIHLFEEIIKLRDEGFPLKDIKAGIDKKRQENIKDNIPTEYEKKFVSKGCPIYKIEVKKD